MKRIIRFFCLIILFCTPYVLMAQQVSLNGDWLFKQSSKNQWNAAVVPGQVHTDLMENNMLKDPFLGINEKTSQWVGEKDWEYSRTFDVDQTTLNNENIELIMEGIDTYADVYINNYLVQKCDNMFRTWVVNAKPYLKLGENDIRIYFHSVFKVDMPKYLEASFRLQAWPNNDQNDAIWLSLYARKAGYNYGWDWGPRLITAGVWRDIYLNCWQNLKYDGVHIFTKEIGSKAKMQADFSIDATSCQDGVLKVMHNGEVLASKEVALKEGENSYSVDFTVKNPELWWSNGLGEQNLYNFDVICQTETSTISQTITTGIRTVETVREIDELGQSFTIRLNGKDVFMKGANYIPLDNFANRVTKEDYEYIVKSAADVNMNMLRVWGGGLYEDEHFYEMCNKYGILVWQDIMFACGMFPADDYYLENVSNEVKDNVKRLRNHPSIALWNGNNENEISYFGWGWRDKYTKEDDKVYQVNLKKLFYDVIPNAIYSQDKSRYYHPTSPNTGYNDIGHNMGDVHFWSVWKGGWVEEYTEAKNIGRFMSEYGFQSYPELSTIRKFAEEKDFDINSEVMLCHQRAKNDATRDPYFGNKMMTMYMEHYFTVPTDFQEFLYMSQLLQAESVKVGIEAHRRAKPYCMGTLYWQINDCWPAASWSCIDYYGKWKALQYFSKNAYSEVLVSPYKSDDLMKVKVISDRLTDLKANLKMTVMTIEGDVVWNEIKPIQIPANGCLDVFECELSKISSKANEEIFVYFEVVEDQTVLSSNTYYPTYANRHKYCDVEPIINVSKSDNGVELAITSDKFIRGLYMWVEDDNTLFKDNYITLIPNTKYIVEVETGLNVSEFRKQLNKLTLNSIIN